MVSEIINELRSEIVNADNSVLNTYLIGSLFAEKPELKNGSREEIKSAARDLYFRIVNADTASDEMSELFGDSLDELQ